MVIWIASEMKKIGRKLVIFCWFNLRVQANWIRYRCAFNE